MKCTPEKERLFLGGVTGQGPGETSPILAEGWRTLRVYGGLVWVSTISTSLLSQICNLNSPSYPQAQSCAAKRPGIANRSARAQQAPIYVLRKDSLASDLTDWARPSARSGKQRRHVSEVQGSEVWACRSWMFTASGQASLRELVVFLSWAASPARRV